MDTPAMCHSQLRLVAYANNGQLHVYIRIYNNRGD